MKKVCIAFSEDEYSFIHSKANLLGFSIPKLIEYAATLYVGVPRTETANIAEIQKKIIGFIKDFEGESFFCATPFQEDWSKMTTSAKRTAAAQMKKLVDEGLIVKINPNDKSHKASIYKKINQLGGNNDYSTTKLGCIHD